MGKGARMKAIIHQRYGRPDVLVLGEVDKPVVGDDQALVRVHASSVNPTEWYGVTGPFFTRPSSGLLKPKRELVGSDLAGRIEAVGRDVEELEPGDEVFGTALGAWAEFACAREARLVRKPANVSFEEAAAVPIAGITALQALRDKGHVQQGQKVLINGASGGVGTFAVQLAKSFGADVTGVCSTRNVELVRSLGADHVIDYTREDFTRSDRRYDLLLDIAGSKSWSACRRVLAPDATLVIVGAHRRNRLFGPIGHIVRLRLASLRGSQKAVFFIARTNRADMEFLSELLEAGKIKPVVDRRYELRDTADAFRYLGEGHARGKVVVTV
jgi:NADPH:quinone reductase-like Zn-dependent oxidoreductase